MFVHYNDLLVFSPVDHDVSKWSEKIHTSQWLVCRLTRRCSSTNSARKVYRSVSHVRPKTLKNRFCLFYF